MIEHFSGAIVSAARKYAVARSISFYNQDNLSARVELVRLLLRGGLQGGK
jgi:hypothetical protein